jgi:prepilin-type N-terminal cleavage/methylation domain-containing protein
MSVHSLCRRTRLRAGSELGFTLMELMVVIIVLTVLAAIAIPSMLNQQAKGDDVTAKSRARQAATAMETCALENSGIYNKTGTPCDKSELIRIEASLADAGSLFDDPVLTRDTYRVTVWSERAPTEVSFAIRREADGSVEHVCSIGAQIKGGCLAPGGSGDDW